MIDVDFIKREIGKYNVQYWDCRSDQSVSSRIILWNKELKQLGESEAEGVGVRVLSNGGWGFSASTKTDKESLRAIIKNAVKIANLVGEKKEKGDFFNDKFVKDKTQIKGKEEIGKISLEEKKNFLMEQNYELNDLIKSVFIRYIDVQEKKLFLSPFREIFQETDCVHLHGSVSAFESGKSEEKLFRIANLGGFEFLRNTQEKIDKAIEESKKFLRAKSIHGGKYDVVLSGELTGLFVHEAVGHASEADIVLRGESFLKGLMGKKIAGRNVNLLDDPTQRDFRGWGSYYYDDEGIKSQKNYILKNGKLKSFLHSIETANEFKTASTGNARAESFVVKPIVRMSNTYVEKGDSKFDEMIEKIKEGYFLEGFQGGQTNTAIGSFQFGVSKAYYVKNGKIIEPMRGGGIGGNALEVLKKIKFVENKYSEDSPGFCGKNDQRVFAGGNNPAVLVEKVNLI